MLEQIARLKMARGLTIGTKFEKEANMGTIPKIQ